MSGAVEDTAGVAGPGQGENVGARLSFDRGARGRRAVAVGEPEEAAAALPEASLLRESLRLPEMSQPDLVRYYTALSVRNYSVDSGMYPLGSCTMKHNPKVHEVVVGLAGFAQAHPLGGPGAAQGVLRCLLELQEYLGAITGLPSVSLAPAAGAQGELAGMLMIKRALRAREGGSGRRRVLVPDSAHGTNPASAAMAGFTTTEIPSDGSGSMDLGALRAALGEDVAALMITMPNTLGLWESNIEEAIGLMHAAGGLVYGDGANLNAIVGRMRYGDLGFDVVHLNLHKTFSTPHGGGGPGMGPVCAGEGLAAYLPAPVVVAGAEGGLELARPRESIGRLQQFHGSVGVGLRALAYIRSLGLEGLRAVSANAVLNANYLRVLLGEDYALPYDRPVLHEVVFSAARQKQAHGVSAYDIAKRLIDYGFHPPTVYFPLIVAEALMIEPTESESRETLEAFAAALGAIAREAERDPALVQSAPSRAPLGRLDEARAARRPVLRWRPGGPSEGGGSRPS